MRKYSYKRPKGDGTREDMVAADDDRQRWHQRVDQCDTDTRRTRRSQHSQECKDPRWQHKWVSRTRRGTSVGRLLILAASIFRYCADKHTQDKRQRNLTPWRG